VIAKRLSDVYAPGERTMIKIKRLRTANCVVGGFRYESKSRQVGSLLLGLYDSAGRLDHVGFTSTIRDAERPTLTRKLEKLRGVPGFTGRHRAARVDGAPSAAENGNRFELNWWWKFDLITLPAIAFATAPS
jgi:ATP-dependent DNA ligase